MSERLVQLVVDPGDADAVCGCLDGLSADSWFRFSAENDRVVIVAALNEVDTQETLDAISDALSGCRADRTNDRHEGEEDGERQRLNDASDVRGHLGPFLPVHVR